MPRSRIILLLFALAAAGSPCARAQSNDSFANRLPLTGPAPVAVSNNLRATRETGEPNHAGAAAGRSLWYTWTAPATGTVSIGTYSTGTGAPVLRAVAVYTGGSLASLSETASSNNPAQALYASGAGGTSLDVPVTAGTVYQIAVDAVVPPAAVNDDGTVVLTINAPPTILSAASATGTVGANFSYAVAATGGPTTYTAANLPSGLSLNPVNGQITGVPGAAGTSSVTLSATGPGGPGNATLTLRVDDPTAPGPAPLVTSAAATRGYVNQTFSYTILATGSPTVYGASGLPAGLSLNPSTGVISGGPTAAGTFVVPVTATGAGGAGTATLTFFIAAGPVPPVVVSALTASGSVGTPFAYNVTTNADPTNGTQYSYVTATGLPGGLKIDSTSNQPLATSTQISGTPTTAGVFVVPLTVNSNAGTRAATLTITILDPKTVVATGPPALTSAATALGSAKTAFNYQLTATNVPTSFSASNLPPGITFDPKANTLSGSPTNPGTFLVPVSATNGFGTATGTLTVTIASSDIALQAADGYALPVITSAASTVLYTGQSTNYVIVANYQGVGQTNNGYWTFAATGLPPGMSLTSGSSSYGTGYIAGTPTTPGTYQATVTATYPASTTIGYGSATVHPAATSSAVVTFVILAGPAPSLPIIRSAATAALTVGSAASYQISVTGGPATYATSALPPGLSLNSSGVITGTPTAAGTYPVTITTANAAGTFSATVTFYVAAGPLPIISSAATAQATVGTAASYGISVQTSGTTFTADNLPPGLSLNAATGAISGTPTAAGMYNVAVAATNPNGTTRVTLVYTVLAPVASPPAIGASLVTRITTGINNAYAVYGYGTATSGSASGLPAGLTFDALSGVISGAPTTPGTYTIPVSATNANGMSTATLTFVVANPPPPVLIDTAARSVTVGTSFSASFLVRNLPSSVTITGLPPGLTYNYAQASWPDGYMAGTIYGTPTTAGTYRASVTAANPGGSVSGTMTFVVNPAPNVPSFQPGTAEERILTVGAAFSESFATSPAATNYTASPLPAGLTVNPATGLVSGTPTTVGTNSVTVTAANASGSASLTTVYVVAPVDGAAPPQLGGYATASGYANLPFPGLATAGTNVAATYAASGLPPGLSIDPATGLITGTPTAAGQYSVNLSATNPAGNSTGVLTILIKSPATVVPQFSYTSAETSCQVGGTPYLGFSATLYDHGTSVTAPMTFSVTGVPPGLTVVPSANGASIQGAATTAGYYTITATATVTGSGVSASESILLWVYNPAGPIIGEGAGESGNVGFPFSSYLYSSPSIIGFAASGLPPGLTLNTTTGTITGTPTAAGTYAVNVSVTGATGTCAGVVTYRIDPPVYGGMPYITSAASVGSQEFPSDGGTAYYLSAQPTTAVRYAITSYNQPTSFAASGLPVGLTLNTATGVISGTPTATGVFQVPISATNAVGTGQAVLTIISTTPLALPQAALSCNGYVGVAYSLAAPAGFPANTPSSVYYLPPSTYAPYVPPAVTYIAVGLPPGLTLNAANGTISGVPTATGNYPVTLSTTDRQGGGSAVVTFSILSGAPPVTVPVLVSSATAAGFVGLPMRYALGTPGATSFTATGLPAGLAFDPATGLLTGTPTAAGIFSSAVSAANTAGTANATLTIDIEAAPAAPILTNPAALTVTVGRPFAGTLAVANGSFAPGAANYTAANLPAGLILDPLTGSLGGTPTGPAGTYTVPIMGSVGPSAVPLGALTLIVQDASAAGPPLLNCAAGALGLMDNHFVYRPDDPAFVPVVGSLPAGLTYDAVMGTISGYPTAAGSFPVPLQAAGSSAGATLTLRVLAPTLSLPRLTTQPTGGTAAQAAGFTFTTAATGAPAPTYQWYRNGAPISGATGSTLTLSALRPTDSGDYTVVAANPAGSVTSPLAALLVATTYGQWQADHFTGQEIAAGVAGDNASFSGDGVSNLLKYALDLDPRRSLGGALPVVGSRPAADGLLEIEFNRDAGATDLDYLVEASPDLRVWTTVARSMAGGPTVGSGGSGGVVESLLAGTSQRHVTVKAAPPAGGSQFLRLRVTRP